MVELLLHLYLTDTHAIYDLGLTKLKLGPPYHDQTWMEEQPSRVSNLGLSVLWAKGRGDCGIQIELLPHLYLTDTIPIILMMWVLRSQNLDRLFNLWGQQNFDLKINEVNLYSSKPMRSPIRLRPSFFLYSCNSTNEAPATLFIGRHLFIKFLSFVYDGPQLAPLIIL